MIHASSTTRDWPRIVPWRTEDVGCRICGTRRSRRLYTENYRLGEQTLPLGINRCAQCRQVYVSPRLDARSTAAVYKLDQTATISHQYCWAGQTSDRRFEPLLDRLVKLVPSGRLLDVGCGSGSFLMSAAQRQCWELEGVEPMAHAAALARTRLNAAVHESTLEARDWTDSRFDVVTMLGVLEHLHEPLDTLKCARRLLTPRGVLAIYVPNYLYLRWKDTGCISWLRTGKWSNLAPQEHLFQFTPRSLQQLLTRAGLRIVQMDVGQPFLGEVRWRRWLKRAAYGATSAIFRSTGLHLGGLEVIATRAPDGETWHDPCFSSSCRETGEQFVRRDHR